VFVKIFWLSLLLAKSLPSSAATYSRDVAPILDRHCVQCHRAGEVGPFPLDTYEAARKHARQIALAASTRFMPPFKPVPPSLTFHRERRMSSIEIRTLQAWASTGAPRGIKTSIPSRPAAPPPPPSETWRMLSPYDLPADGPDQYRCFVIPTQLKDARYIDAFEFLPGNRRVVHHALMFFDLSGAARKLDAESDGPGYPCFGTPGFLPTSSLGGWSPGNGLLQMPPGTAIKAPAGADLVFQIHYHFTGKPESDTSAVAVRYSEKPPQKKLLDIPLTSKAIDIPAGQSRYEVTDYFELPVDITLWQIIPHAHFIAREVRAWATPPGGLRKPLLTITDWDFNWQDIYQLKTPLHLKAGTLLEMQVRYDNSDANARNPNRPPQRVLWGPGTTDEMAGVHFNVTVDNEARDLEDLTHSLWGKMIRAIRQR